mmetsp:Transcript_22563/g.32228  ORF Transcript_22563/g.32228 Transcript_22563/m.32228 type:complete len:101 (+) Transcript_22563:449-751(+)
MIPMFESTKYASSIVASVTTGCLLHCLGLKDGLLHSAHEKGWIKYGMHSANLFLFAKCQTLQQMLGRIYHALGGSSSSVDHEISAKNFLDRYAAEYVQTR